MTTCRHCPATVRGRRVCDDCAAERKARQPVRQGVETADGDRVGSWIRVDGTWHASIRFDGHEHGFACGEVFDDFPAEDAESDHYRVSPTAICEGCADALEDVQVLEDGFSSAGELRADGGVDLHGYEVGKTASGSKIHLVDFESRSALVLGTGRGPDMTLCSVIGDHEPHELEYARVDWCQRCYDRARQVFQINLDDVARQLSSGDASQVATDGGLEEVFRRETIVPTTDGIAIGEDAIPMVGGEGPAGFSVIGPDPVAFEFLEERGPMSDDAELREDLRAVVRRHDPDAETLREVAADLEQLADRFEATTEVL